MRASTQPPFSFSPCSVNFRSPLANPSVGVALGLPGASVPQLDSPGPVFAFWDDPLETAVFERVVLNPGGQAPVVRIEGRSLRDGP